MKGKESKPKRGRPKSRILNIDATPEYVARAIFAAADAKIKKRFTKKKERFRLGLSSHLPYSFSLAT